MLRGIKTLIIVLNVIEVTTFSLLLIGAMNAQTKVKSGQLKHNTLCYYSCRTKYELLLKTKPCLVESEEFK